MKYLVTGNVEFYQWVEADSEDEARQRASKGQWRQTINQPIQELQIKPMEIETIGEEKK